MLSSILGIFQTLKTIVDGIKGIISYVEASRKEAWFQDWSKAMIKLRNAKTSEERQEAAGAIQDSLSKL